MCPPLVPVARSQPTFTVWPKNRQGVTVQRKPRVFYKERKVGSGWMKAIDVQLVLSRILSLYNVF